MTSLSTPIFRQDNHRKVMSDEAICRFGQTLSARLTLFVPQIISVYRFSRLRTA